MAQHKLTQAQLISLAASVGVDVELVADDSQSDFATANLTNDALIQSVDKSREGIISAKLKDGLNSEIYGTVSKKVNNSMRKAVAELLGVPESEISDKDAKEALTIGLKAYGQKFEGDKAQFQQQLTEVLEKHKNALADKEKEWETKYNGKVGELTEREIVEHMIAAHKEAKGLPPTANIEMLAKTAFMPHVNSKAIVKIENGQPVLYDKNKPETRLLNEAGSNFATLNEMVQPFYTTLGMWQNDNRNIRTPKPGEKSLSEAPKTDDNGKVLSPRDQRMSVFPDDYGKTA